MPDKAPLQSRLTSQQDALGATANGVRLVEAPFAGTVTSVSYTAIAAVTGANSPASRTLSVVNKGADGTGTTAVATLALTSGVDLAAADEKAVTLTATAADKVVAAGDVLALNSTAVGGTGLADPGGTWEVIIERS